jgi:hypothetical protein
MTIYVLSNKSIVEVPQVSFAELGLREREDVQRLLREFIHVISPDTMILAEEFGDWEDSRRRIDLLGLAKDGCLVVIELKRTEDGGHMELQALRYAAMVSTMRFEQAVSAHATYLRNRGESAEDAERRIRDFLVSDDGPVAFSSEVRIVLASADFSREITSSVLWLNSKGMDITCVRMRPHRLDNQVLLDVQQVIPLPEAAEFQIAIREKSDEIQVAKAAGRDFTKYDLRTKVKEFLRLPKRQFIFELVREAVRLGLKPDDLFDAVPWRRTNLFLSKNGKCSGLEVVDAADKDSRRYFCGDDEVFYVDGSTYVLSNQWGVRTEEAAENILRLLPDDHGIDYKAVPQV